MIADRSSPRDHVIDPDQALAAVDRLAEQAIGWIKPIELSCTRSTAERETAYRLRYQAVIDHGWLSPSDFPDGLERDRYDDQAVHLLARDQGQVIATARLIFPQPYRLLPTEEAFDLMIEPRGQVVDAGRFVVAKSHSSLEHRVLASMLAYGWLQVRSRGYSMVCAAFASKAMLRVYQRMGFRMTTLAPPRRVWGEDRSPILFDVPSSADALIDRWTVSEEMTAS
jgi:N-acyl-L-homoserine lactone synthetase